MVLRLYQGVGLPRLCGTPCRLIAVSWVEPHRSIHIRHADEEDPELMAQDYEGFPRQWYNEGFMSEDDFDNILEYSDMCDKHGQEAVDDYMEFHDELDNFEEAYCGEWDSEEDFARHIIDECYNLESEMGDLARYFDYEAFGRDLFMYDYSMGANGNVFRVV